MPDLLDALKTREFVEYHQKLGGATKAFNKAKQASTLLEFVNYLDESIADITVFRNEILKEMKERCNLLE